MLLLLEQDWLEPVLLHLLARWDLMFSTFAFKIRHVVRTPLQRKAVSMRLRIIKMTATLFIVFSTIR